MLSFSVVLFLFEKHSLMQFRVLAFTGILLGIITTIYYICFVKEKALTAEAEYKERLFSGVEPRTSLTQ
jgi:preprotein translocase subunit SecF